MKYTQFIFERDKALEKILNKYQSKISDIAGKAFDEIIQSFLVQYISLSDDLRFTSHGRRIIEEMKYHAGMKFDMMCWEISALILDLKRIVKHLTYSSELEALAKLKDKKDLVAKSIQLDSNRNKVYAKMILASSKQRKAFLDSIERAYVNEETPIELKSRLVNSKPPTSKIKRVLKKVKESSVTGWGNQYHSITQDTIDDETWDKIVRGYKEEYIPDWRSKDKSGKFLKTYDERYAWEVEQEVTQDFLQDVKDGTVEAANQAGITDFMWIAVLDQKTRFSHSQFDGMLSTEIQEKLNGEWKNDERFDQDREYFDGGLPAAPSGFNCRCRSVPFLGEIDKNLEGLGSFDEWLESN